MILQSRFKKGHVIASQRTQLVTESNSSVKYSDVQHYGGNFTGFTHES